MRLLENFYLKYFGLKKKEGPLALDCEVEKIFLSAPYDMLPDFKGLASLRRGRGKDHPRYGRFVYALAKHFQPQTIVEVGSFAGGTSVGWARALRENGTGRLTCIDNNSYYGTHIYPDITRRNILATGLTEDRFDLLCGDSIILLGGLAEKLPGSVDLYLVDADHTYEGAHADLVNGLPMMKKGGLVLVHDVDTGRPMAEETPEHPHPVYEAFMQVVSQNKFEWCILKYIRKNLGIFKVG